MQARKFLEHQAQDWATLSGAVADWLAELAHLLEDYHAKTGVNEGDVRGALKVGVLSGFLFRAWRTATLRRG